MESIKQYDAPRAVASYAGLAVTHAPRPRLAAPKTAAQGTAVSFAGGTRTSGLDVTDANAPGSPPREAPV